MVRKMLQTPDILTQQVWGMPLSAPTLSNFCSERTTLYKEQRGPKFPYIEDIMSTESWL